MIPVDVTGQFQAVVVTCLLFWFISMTTHVETKPALGCAIKSHLFGECCKVLPVQFRF